MNTKRRKNKQEKDINNNQFIEQIITWLIIDKQQIIVWVQFTQTAKTMVEDHNNPHHLKEFLIFHHMSKKSY